MAESESESSLEISLPKLEKLDLQCIPQREKLNWLKPGGFRNLKKLYIRGGKLKSLNLGTDPEPWNVKTLRLKFLRELEWDDWSEFEKTFPSLACIEIYECPKLEAKPASHPPLDEDGVWKKNEANSSDMPSCSSRDHMD